METITFIFCLLGASLGLAIFSNRARERHSVDFTLKPNCLLTRWPLLFVTGPRSLFYFSSYWNLYTSFLAEHGYEVFTLHLPWRDPELRKERLLQFLTEQEKAQRHFHLFVDRPTFQEFENFLRQHKSEAIRSLTEITEATQNEGTTGRLSALPFPCGHLELVESKRLPVLLKVAYTCHRFFFRNKNLLALSSLGGPSEINLQNSLRLLERSQELAEMDLRADT